MGYTTAEHLIRLIFSINDNTMKLQICKIQPIGMLENATFLIDLEEVTFCDLKSDNMGSWKATGTKSIYYKFSEGTIVSTSCHSQNCFILKRHYFIHGTYQTFHCLISDVAGK